MYKILERPGDPPQYFILKTLGGADPKLIIDSVSNTELRGQLYVDQVLTVIDSSSWTENNYDSATTQRQLIHADTVLLSKTDLVPHERVKEVIANIIDVKPNTRVLKSQKGYVPIAALFDINITKSRFMPKIEMKKSGHKHGNGKKDEHEHKPDHKEKDGHSHKHEQKDGHDHAHKHEHKDKDDHGHKHEHKVKDGHDDKHEHKVKDGHDDKHEHKVKDGHDDKHEHKVRMDTTISTSTRLRMDMTINTSTRREMTTSMTTRMATSISTTISLTTSMIIITIVTMDMKATITDLVRNAMRTIWSKKALQAFHLRATRRSPCTASKMSSWKTCLG